MTVLKSAQAFLEHLEEVDPNLASTPPEIHAMTAGQLGAVLVQELPGQAISTEEWRTRLNATDKPLEAAKIVLQWIQHRQQTLDKENDLQERRTAEMPLQQQMS